ncbi:MAG: hypothetical protein JWN48_5737 [Myxococcaceae bacterium]|nr:hypothetical protein [Myxococcaceae bacterium]
MLNSEQRKRAMIEAFDHSILRDSRSAVFREYCLRVHGVDRFQYNSLTNQHFELLLEGLDLAPGDSFADVGCAAGAMTVEVARRTRARGLGLDAAAAAIALARQSAPTNVDVMFQEGDLDELELPASRLDGVMVIDALYFARDLEKTIGVLMSALRPGGRLVAFHSTFRRPDDPASVLTPDGTALATALRSHGADYACTDLTADDREHWQRAVTATQALRSDWEAAGELDAWQARLEENTAIAPLVEAGRSARFLYVGWRS